jgi:hypothetical protein
MDLDRNTPEHRSGYIVKSAYLNSTADETSSQKYSSPTTVKVVMRGG